MEKKVSLINSGFDSLLTLQKLLLDTLDYETVVYKVVNALLFDLGFIQHGYRIIVLTLYNKKRKVLERVALSQTKEAERALEVSAIPFHEIAIPLSSDKNLLIRSLKDKKIYITHYWPEIFVPALTEKQSLINQQAAGIKTSMLVPVFVRDEVIGVLIFSMVKGEDAVTKEEKKMIQGFSEIVGLAVQNSRLYSDLADAKDSLINANHRLKELDLLKDEFVSLASHELRTPMTAIKSYLWMALNKPPAPLHPEMKSYLDISYKSTERLIHLVNDMLTVSRIERNKVELHLTKVNLYEVVKQVYDELKITADEKKIQFTIDSHKSDLEIECDKDKIREVIQNLVGNSLKFTPANGKVTINIEKDAKNYLIAVVDTGSGIPKDEMNKLFTKFGRIDYSYTQHANSPGTGLGLYISKQIISLHHGEIQVQSEINKGSTFTIVLPENQPKEQKHGSTE